MKVFESLISAKKHGQQLAKEGQIPSIYQRDHCEFLLLTNKETPPPGAFPFMKWVGKNILLTDESEWVPILAQLDSLVRAREACALFYLLGHEPIIVEYSAIGTFDIFLKEDDIPLGAWIIVNADDDHDLFEVQPPQLFYNEDDAAEFEVHLQNY